MERDHRGPRRAERRDQGGRRMGLRRRPAPAGHGHRAAARRRRGAHHRRPLRRRQGAPRRVHDRRRARSGRRARVGPQAGAGDHAADRGAAVPGRAGADAGVPTPAAEIERVFRAEYGRAVAVLVRVFGDIDVAEDAVQDAFTAALQRWPADGAAAEPGGLDHHHGPQPGDRPPAPRGVARRPARAGGAAARRATTRPRRAPCATTGCA